VSMTGTLLYDADCGFCTRVAKLLPPRGVPAVPMQSVDLPGRGVDPGRATREVPFVDGAGDVTYGHEAIAAALRSADGRLWRVGGRLLGSRAVAPLARPGYRWVATHRHQLPGGSAACELPAQTTPAQATPAQTTPAKRDR
jgi:predicted DCC family thiol-disulfide oxidoreductase YuxK